MRFLCVVIGYLCGCFLTAEIVARCRTGKSAYEIGTGNPGMANIAGQLGVKWAAVTLLGDVLKTALPCFLCRYALFPRLGRVAVLYAGLGASLGHGFPFWKRFRGGRSVAVTCTYIVLFSPLWGLAADLAGLGAVLATGYLMIGALAIPCLFIIPAFCIYGPEAGLAAAAGAALTVILHRDALRRMKNGAEKKTELPAKLKKPTRRAR